MDAFKEILGNQILKQRVKEAQRTIQDLELYTALIYKLDRKLLNDPIYTDDELNDLIVMIDLVKCHYHGKYTTIENESLVLIVGALLYWVSEFDVIPDFIPVIGLLDDEAVLQQSVNKTKEALEQFKLWRHHHKVDI